MLQIKLGCHELAINQVQVLGRDHVHVRTSKTPPRLQNVVRAARESRKQQTNPKHMRWFVRTSPPGHRAPELLDDSAKRRGIKRFPKLQRVPQRLRGQALRAALCAFDA
jgi:hypothetical protein